MAAGAEQFGGSLVLWTLALSLVIGCDAPRTPDTPPPPKDEPAPFTITPKVWGAAEAGATFEVRELPDGTPGLFDGDGALLLHLLPELVIDASEAGARRPKPTTRRFELIKLTPNPDGGFTMFARLTDANALAYDLRIENGPNDPRIHVGLLTKWGRDVTLHREVLRFRTGALGGARGMAHDYSWADVESEWVGPRHVPPAVSFGERLTVLGRTGVENIVVRSVEDRWDVELEAYHYHNHPLEVGDRCDESLDGAATFEAGSRFEMRADFVVGPTEAPFVFRYPGGKRAAVSLVDVQEGGARIFAAPELGSDVSSPAILARQQLWLGESVTALPCEDGRYQTLAKSGIEAMWSGVTMPSSGADLLAPTETDARRAFAFGHPGVSVPTLFALSDGDPDPGWFDPAALARLKTDHGLIVVRAPLDEFLGRDASATQTVREAVTALERDGTVWLAGVDEVASRLHAVTAIDVDVLPEGVIRVRNASKSDLRGVTLLLPDGHRARYASGDVHESGGQMTWFDLAAGRDQLLQLFRDDEPAWAMKPAGIVVSYEPNPEPAQPSDKP